MNHIPDLTQRAPRSPRVRLGGYVILPRMLDKGRAFAADKNGEYHYNCPLDERFTQFIGVNADQLLEQIKAGLGDGELLQWINKNSATPKDEIAIAQWSDFCERRVVSDVETREFFNSKHKEYGPHREDIVTWFDLLDLDDYVSFGGKA
jgi:hypothetical protein